MLNGNGPSSFRLHPSLEAFMRVMKLSRALVVYSLAAAILGSALYLATSDVSAIAETSTLPAHSRRQA